MEDDDSRREVQPTMCGIRGHLVLTAEEDAQREELTLKWLRETPLDLTAFTTPPDSDAD